MSLGNGYTIDLESGWTMVHSLQAALDKLQAGWQANIEGIQILPPGNDGHSKGFSKTATQEAIDEHRNWYYGQVQWFTSMVNTATGILKQYGIAETENTIQWSATDADSSGTIPPESKGGGRGAN